jgi:hypothetical protein
MAYFTFSINGNTYTSDPANAVVPDGYRFIKYGYVTALANLAVDIVAVAAQALLSATNAAASAATALNAPGTTATSATSLTIDTVAQALAIQTGKSIPVGATIKVANTPSPSNWMLGDVTSYDSATGALGFICTSISGSGTFNAWTISISGPEGPAGGAVTIEQKFSTATADADPTNGFLRLDNATQNLATTIRADLLDQAGKDWTTVLDTFDASTSPVKGQIRIAKKGDRSKWLVFNLTARAAPAGYRNFTVTCIGSSSANPFANNDNLILHFSRTGDVAGAGGAVSGNIAVGRALTSASAGVQIVTPTAPGVKDTFPDATTLSTGIGNFFHKNASDTYQHGLSDKGGTLRAVIGPNGKASSNLADKGTVAGTWGIECDNEDGALALCEQALAATYTTVLTLSDGNGGASRLNHARSPTAKFISATAAVAVVKSASSTYLVGFDDTGLSAPQLLDANLAQAAMVVRTPAGGFVVWSYNTPSLALKIAGFTMNGNLPQVGTVFTLSTTAADIATTAGGSSGSNGMAWTVLDTGATWVIESCGSGAAGHLWAVTQAGNLVTVGAALTSASVGGLSMLFSTGNTTFGQIGYQVSATSAAVLQTNTVTGVTIANTASTNYVASTTTNAKPVSVAKLTGTTKFAFTYNDGSVCNTNIATITGGTAIALGVAVDTSQGTANAYDTAINVYDATRYAVWNGALAAAALAPKYFTETAGSPVKTDPGLTFSSAQSVLLCFLDNATALYIDAAISTGTPGSITRLRKIAFSGSAFSYTGPNVEAADISSGLAAFSLGATVCGGVAVFGLAAVVGGMKYNFLNKGRYTRYLPRLAGGSATGVSQVDANSTATRVASCLKGTDGLIVPLMMEIPTY